MTGFPANVLVAGASGLIGTALVSGLRASGVRVRTLVRRPPRGADEVYWNPDDGMLPAVVVDESDALINFAGANIAGGRWTARRRQLIRESRLATTSTLARALSSARRKPAVWINASAVGFYGSRGREVLNEDSGAGRGFLADVCEQWEAATEARELHETRVVFARFGMVLSPVGGALARMLPFFRAGLGGRLGSGDQWMSWISLDDVVAALCHALTTPGCSEAVNFVSPQPVTNREFTSQLARQLHRPAVLPVPAPALRLLFGQMATETLLASQRAVPAKLLAGGFRFRHETLESALREVLRER